MDTNNSGSVYGNRQGSQVIRQTLQFTPTTNGTGVVLPLFPIIQANAGKPTIIECQIFINALDAGAGAALSIGTTVTSNELIAAASLASANFFLPASNNVAKLFLTADTTIFYKTAGVINGTAIVTVIMDIATVNLTNVAA